MCVCVWRSDYAFSFGRARTRAHEDEARIDVLLICI